jgi:hypothetical protein
MNYSQLFSTEYYDSEDNCICNDYFDDYCNYIDQDRKTYITKFYCTNGGCLPKNLIKKWKIKKFGNRYVNLLTPHINLAILSRKYVCDEYYFLFVDNEKFIAMSGRSSAPWHHFGGANATSLIHLNFSKDKADVMLEVPFIPIDLNNKQSLKQSSQSLFDKLMKLRAFA